MSDTEWVEYARLLRQSWCNPSYKPWQVAVCQFEHAHHELHAYFRKWQNLDVEEGNE